ncbi:hypothetical protein [Vreelandella malpeensis]|uniref:Uncharacterized protein n=1 Tax=Vreelandella malpeensis TaxID=1172368 RepID=A0ABS8DWE9_9GAMM|nr:hypothetical protein [Halomonas malpeensis]MCB8890569.1 hypothetical protein [Halomonas malpeensis]
METLSKWLEKKDVAAEEMALDYLNKKGFFGKNKKLSAIEQIREIERENARDLYFKDCERKLKNNIRQNVSKNKNPDLKPCTFKLPSSSRNLLEKIKNHYGITASQTLEMLIHNENLRLLGAMNHHAPNVNASQSYALPIQHNYSHDFGKKSVTTPLSEAEFNEYTMHSLELLKSLNINTSNMHSYSKINGQEDEGWL